MKRKEKKADLEGSAEDAEFDKGHGSEERGWQLQLDRPLLCPLHPRQTDVIEIC
jgi:hypothetical protein